MNKDIAALEEITKLAGMVDRLFRNGPAAIETGCHHGMDNDKYFQSLVLRRHQTPGQEPVWESLCWGLVIGHERIRCFIQCIAADGPDANGWCYGLYFGRTARSAPLEANASVPGMRLASWSPEFTELANSFSQLWDVYLPAEGEPLNLPAFGALCQPFVTYFQSLPR